MSGRASSTDGFSLVEFRECRPPMRFSHRVPRHNDEFVSQTCDPEYVSEEENVFISIKTKKVKQAFIDFIERVKTQLHLYDRQELYLENPSRQKQLYRSNGKVYNSLLFQKDKARECRKCGCRESAEIEHVKCFCDSCSKYGCTYCPPNCFLEKHISIISLFEAFPQEVFCELMNLLKIEDLISLTFVSKFFYKEILHNQTISLEGPIKTTLCQQSNPPNLVQEMDCKLDNKWYSYQDDLRKSLVKSYENPISYEWRPVLYCKCHFCRRPDKKHWQNGAIRLHNACCRCDNCSGYLNNHIDPSIRAQFCNESERFTILRTLGKTTRLQVHTMNRFSAPGYLPPSMRTAGYAIGNCVYCCYLPPKFRSHQNPLLYNNV